MAGVSDINNVAKVVGKNTEVIGANTKTLSDIGIRMDDIVSGRKGKRKGNANGIASELYGGAAARRRMGKGSNNIISLLGEIATKIGDFFTPEGFGRSLKFLLPATSEFFERWSKVQKSMYSVAREMGISTQQIDGFTKSIAKNTVELGNKLGMTYEEIGKLISSYTNTTGRNLFFSEDEVRRMSEMYRLGGDAAVGITSELDRFGMSINNSADHFAKIQLNSEAYGLNASKYTKDFQQNIRLAASYSFKNGIDGINKMTMLSERLKFNMQNVAQVADRASTIEGAIDMSAKMQMLGGTYAQNFGNPVQLLYESLNDMEALTKRIANTVQGKASFNDQTGQFNVDNITRRFLKEMANMTGMSFDDLFNMSVSNDRIRLIDAQMRATVKARESDRQFIENQARYDTDTRKWVMTWLDKNGNTITKSVAEIDASDMADIKEGIVGEDDLNKDVHVMRELLQKYMSEKGVKLTSADERITGAKSAYDAKAFQIFNGWFKGISEWFGGLKLNGILGFSVGAAFGFKALGGILTKIGGIKSLVSGNKGGAAGGGSPQMAQSTASAGGSNYTYTRAERLAASKELSSRGYTYRNGKIYRPDGTLAKGNVMNGTGKVDSARVLAKEEARAVRMSKQAAGAGKEINAVKGATNVAAKSTVTEASTLTKATAVPKVANASRVASGFKNMSNFSKALGGVGTAVALVAGGIEIASNVSNYRKRRDAIMNSTDIDSYTRQRELRKNLENRQIENGKAIGGTIGGIVGAAALSWTGPIGMAIGGVVGGVVGRAVGSTVGKIVKNRRNKKEAIEMVIDTISPNIEAISTNVGIITRMMGAGAAAQAVYYNEETAQEMAAVQEQAFNGYQGGVYEGQFEYGGGYQTPMGYNGGMSVQPTNISTPSVYISTPNVGQNNQSLGEGKLDVQHSFTGTIQLKSEDKFVELSYSQMNEIASMVTKEMLSNNNSGALGKNTPYMNHRINQGGAYGDGRTPSRT